MSFQPAKLMAKHGEHVFTATVPMFLEPADVIVFGDRYFKFFSELEDDDGTLEYREAHAFHISDAEPINELPESLQQPQ
jgi:hypothetical protein